MNLKKTIYCLLLCVSYPAVYMKAADFEPQFSSQHTIKYWRNSVVKPESDNRVLRAQEIFNQLLRSWDKVRIAPSLYVVKSSTGAWAASLEDGNILLSYGALSLMQVGRNIKSNQLAFVLAHEISHQRSDDLWQQKYFRMTGGKSYKQNSNLTNIVDLKAQDINDLERREAQADADGLVLMSLVGFDPLQIIDDKAFFVQWAEAVWKSVCSKSKKYDDAFTACEHAKLRTRRAHIKLTDIAVKSSLFELGVQAFVLGRYMEARSYFTAFGRDYPYAVVYENIANSFLAEALSLNQQYLAEFEPDKPQLYYPIILAASPVLNLQKIQEIVVSDKTRSLSKMQRKNELKKKINYQLEQSISFFQRAIQIAPNNAGTYLRLAMSHMLQENYATAQGILVDKYKRLFKEDDGSKFFTALLFSLRGNENQSKSILLEIIDKPLDQVTSLFLSTELLIYAARYNYSTLSTPFLAQKNWKNLIKKARQGNKTLLFRYAIKNITSSKNEIIKPNTVELKKILNQATKNISQNSNQHHDVWLEGDRLRLFYSANGIYSLVTDNNKIKALWAKSDGSKQLYAGTSVNRMYKTLGLPTRQVFTTGGKYLSYRNLDVSFFVQDNKVSGWFLHL